MRPPKTKFLLLGVLLLLGSSVVLSVVSFFPVAVIGKQTAIIIDSTFKLTMQETYRQGLGSFHGDENVTININTGGGPVNFTLLTYGGPRYSNLA